MIRLAAAVVIFIGMGTCGAMAADSRQRPEIPIADFEGDDYGQWKTTGTAFGNKPARGTLPRQMPVSGFVGRGLANSFHGGDAPTGTLTSPPLKVERNYLTFLIGGGGHPQKTCINLLVDGQIVRTATGPNTRPGGSEALGPASWEVGDLQGKLVQIQIVDAASGGWGHVNVDQIVLTDRKPSAIIANATRQIAVERRFLFFPVKTGAAKRKLAVLLDGRPQREFDIELADGKPDWWAPLDVRAWKGQSLTIQVDQLPDDSQALAAIEQGNELKGEADLYREPLRPQLHFSPRRGWNNDPNGLVFADGQYHLFFQHNPYGWSWGNMHWGHAVSRDLVHWHEREEALYPDAFGPMFSGSAVVDEKNTSGLGTRGRPPLVLFYTAAGNPTVQCLAYSTDGGNTFAKYAGNPIVGQITRGNRDPKVIWHEPTRRWVMVLYVGLPDKRQCIDFLTSPDLKTWKPVSRIEGFYECPDLFELPLDGKPADKKWVLTAANSEYMVGRFDGTTFTPETAKLKGHRGRGFYAAQTFSDIPASDGRRIQIGWLQAGSPGMPFNQAMTVPLELKLLSTAAGPRLAWPPVRELNTLRGPAVRGASRDSAALELQPGDANPLAGVNGDAMDIVTAFEPSSAAIVTFNIRGVPITYDAATQEIAANGLRAAAPLHDGQVDIRIVADRTAFEIFADGGLTYLPLPVIPKGDARSVIVKADGGPIKFSVLEAYQLRSIWDRQ